MMSQRKRIPLPLGLGLSGAGKVEWRNRGHIDVQSGGKAPKRRFSPGQFIWVENQLWEIVYAYRVTCNPSEWLYCLEMRQELKSARPNDKFGQVLATLGAGSKTPRVADVLFQSDSQAYTFFADIPRNADSKVFSNKMLLQKKAEVRSSGEVLDPTDLAKQN